MGFHYKIAQDKANFITLTVVDWVDVFTRKNHKFPAGTECVKKK